MNSSTSQSDHVLALSKEVLDDIELDRVACDKILLKCVRLARLTGSDEVRKWLSFEMGGFNSQDSVSLKYMGKTGRWTDFEAKKGYWSPLAQLSETISTYKAKLSAMQIPSISGEYINVAISNVMNRQTEAANSITKLSGVVSRVVSLMHSFASEAYYEQLFSALAGSIFDTYKNEVDRLVSIKASDVLLKLPSIVDRLRAGDAEAVSQALTTCRRVIEAFADEIYPPTSATVIIGGNTLSLDASKHLNRLNAYFASKTRSASRQHKFRQNIKNLYDRVSTGVHADVTIEEAYSLFLNVYLILGEVITMPDESPDNL